MMKKRYDQGGKGAGSEVQVKKEKFSVNYGRAKTEDNSTSH